MYLDFLNSMKQREPGFIEIEDFVEIFLAENETDMTCLPVESTISFTVSSPMVGS